MYRFIIGIDISKATIDVSYTSDGVPSYLGQYPNSAEGFIQMIKDLTCKTKHKIKY